MAVSVVPAPGPNPYFQGGAHHQSDCGGDQCGVPPRLTGNGNSGGGNQHFPKGIRSEMFSFVSPAGKEAIDLLTDIVIVSLLGNIAAVEAQTGRENFGKKGKGVVF